MEVISLAATPQRRFVLAVIAGFFAVSALIYGRAVLQSEFVRWDDGMLVYENPVIRELTPRSIGRIFSMYDPELYIPLTFLSYQIDYQIGGIAPFQYHFTSFLFHTLNALLVAWFAALFFLGAGRPADQQAGKYARSPGYEIWLGIFCGAVFLLHPLHTEAIMWVSGRKDLLSTFFFLLTLVMWLRYQEEPVRRRVIAAIAFFTLALLSKVMAITLPVILLLLDWRQKRALGKEMFVEKIPFFALSIVFGLIGIGGKTSVVASSSTWEKIIMAGKSSLFYLQKIVWPDFFSLLYAYHNDVTVTSPDFYIPILVWLLIAIFALWALKKTRDIAFGLLFFFVTLAPTFLNFTKGGDLDVYFASDRYAYVPSIGIFIAVIGVIHLGMGMFMNEGGGEAVPRPYIGMSSIGRYVLVAGASTIVIILGFFSYRQSEVWRTTYTLLSNVLVYYPESHVAHNNIGNSWRLEGRLDDAIGEFEKALAIKPHPKIYANLGAVYRKQGKLDQAMDAYAKALALNPQSKDAYMGRGLVWLAQKNYAAAEADFLSALTISSVYLEAHTNLGATYVAMGKIDDAIREYRLALAVNPFFPDAHYNLAVALVAKNLPDQAIDEYASTVSLAPNFIPARINLGLLLYQKGDRDGARAQFAAVLRIDPNNVSARKAIGQIDAMQ